MQTVGIDIGTTTISGVVLEKNGTQKPRILKAKTIENGSFLTTTKDWERIQDAEKIVKKSRQMLDDFLDEYPEVEKIGLTGQMHGIVYIDKEGNLSEKKTSGVTAEQFTNLQKYMYTVIKQISKEILGGNIDLKPYYKDKKTPCKYCDYKSICGFNMGGCENKYNYIDKKSKEEILSKIRQ